MFILPYKFNGQNAQMYAHGIQCVKTTNSAILLATLKLVNAKLWVAYQQVAYFLSTKKRKICTIT